jgi:type I restriction-modification system DNA methylase subunit
VIISIWLIYCTIKKNKVYLSDSEKWFIGKVNSEELVMSFIKSEEIENSGLFNIIIDSNMKDIFPYISEAFQFKSLDISQENIMKKEKGLFFTPADVSDFLANKVINNFASISDEIPTCLDPACGSARAPPALSIFKWVVTTVDQKNIY